MKDAGRVGKTAVVAGTITNDVRLFEVPKLTVWNIRFFFSIFCVMFQVADFCLFAKIKGLRFARDWASSRQNNQGRRSDHHVRPVGVEITKGRKLRSPVGST